MRISMVLLAAVAFLGTGCIAQESGRFDLTGDLPSYNVTSVGAIQEAADGGDANATRLLGDMYYWGDKVEPDRAMAEEYWSKAAAGGDPVAAQRMAALRDGQPIPVYTDGGAARRVTMGFWERTILPAYDFEIDVELF